MMMMRNLGEDYGELLESDESDESDEAFDEARRGGRRWNRVQTANRGNAVPQKPGQGFATKAELQATAQRLDARIATNSKAIATVDARTRTLETEAAKLRADVRREVAERKTSTDALKKGLGDLQQMALLLPLLSTQQTTPLKMSDGTTQNVVIDNGDQLSKLLPIMFLSGGLGSGGLTGSGDTSGIGMLAMMIALTGSKK